MLSSKIFEEKNPKKIKIAIVRVRVHTAAIVIKIIQASHIVPHHLSPRTRAALSKT
jgi:hypothetical protein